MKPVLFGSYRCGITQRCFFDEEETAKIYNLREIINPFNIAINQIIKNAGRLSEEHIESN